MPITQQEFEARATRIRWMLFDVDGVMTSRLLYTGTGEAIKAFNPKDGFGIRAAMSVGIEIGALSGRSSPPLERRLADLGFQEVILGRSDKDVAFAEFLDKHQVQADEVAFMGDDLPDLLVASRVGLSFAPADAASEVLARVHRVVKAKGGEGAVREMIEILLRMRGSWDTVVSRYLD
jgi:3-deoxy-D-manno-octulosonate 8-phosphate phosphatase (KDO 8-P phosphatase)